MPYVSDLLTAAAASVTGTPTPTRTWQWLRDGIAISGATSATYTVDPADEGSQISVRQIESNFGGADTATSVATSAVLAFDPIALFGSGEEGAWYDPSDLSTMYQDAAGTTPVTAAGQPVGLILEKSKGLTLGTELVDTANDAAAWTPYGSNTVEQDGDAVKIIYVGSSNGAVVSLTAAGGLSADLTPGNAYQVTMEAKVSGGSANVNLYTTTNNTSANLTGDVWTPVSYTIVWPTGSVNLLRASGMSSGETIWFRNISVRELPGNHATQTTSAARPVLQTSGGLWYLDFDGVDDGMSAAFAAAQAQPNSIGVGFKFDAYADKQYDFVFDSPAASAGGSRHVLLDSVGNLTAYAGANVVLGSSDISDNVVVTHFNTPNSFARKNGSVVFSAQNTGPAAWSGIVIGSDYTGGARSIDGRIYSFVGVNRTLTAGEIDALESYLANKSGVTLP